MHGSVHHHKVNLSNITDAVILRKTPTFLCLGRELYHNFWNIPGPKSNFKYWKTRLYAKQQFILSFNQFSSHFTL